MRWRSSLIILLLGTAAAWSDVADVRPHDFAYGMPIKVTAEGAAYRLTVPIEVYKGVAHDDLSDLRIFNARGDVVPYEIKSAANSAPTRSPGVLLPLFPLRADARASLNGVRITVQSAGAAVDLRTSPGAASPPTVITSYVLDARASDQPLSAFLLHWPAGAAEFSGAVRVESSDDLRVWRVARDDIPVLNLHTGGAELVQSRVDFPSTEAKFWRLSWLGAPAPFELLSVTGEPTPQPLSSRQSSVTVSGSAVAKKDNELAFDLGARLPVTQVNLLLPDANSVLKIELLSRSSATDPWHTVSREEFYRVNTSSSEHSNEPISIPKNLDRFWLVRQVQPAGPIGPLRLEAMWDAKDVLFLARGAGPFLLAYGNGSASAASVSLDSLLKEITVMPALTGSSFALGGADRLRLPPRTVPWKLAVLWTALGMGVLLLAWMAYRLSHDLGSRTPAARQAEDQ